jgi:hypothetical protein
MNVEIIKIILKNFQKYDYQYQNDNHNYYEKV